MVTGGMDRIVSDINEGVVEVFKAWTPVFDLLAAVVTDLGEALDGLGPWEEYRDALEGEVSMLPWWERVLWRAWIWGLDRLGYHWECGPMPGGGVFYSGHGFVETRRW